jgi:uncharacterized delta-60 repeat protein
VRALVVQSDGRILAGGEFTSYNGTACNRLARLNANGTLDTSFVTAMNGGADNKVNALAIESTGKILVGGTFANFAGSGSFGLARLLTTGARDTGSPLSLPFYTGWSPDIRTVLAQSDGKIMVGGLFAIQNGSVWILGVARLNSNGTRDTSFDPGVGAHLAGSPNSGYPVETILQQPDGKYLIGGQFTAYNQNAAPRLARANATGSFDSSFTPPAFNSTVATLCRQPAGTVVVGGWYNSPAGCPARLSNSGAIDTTFNEGTGANGSIYAIAPDSTGNLWLGGNFYSYNGTTCWPLVKVAGGVAGYDIWAASKFTTAQIAAGVAAPYYDADGDGIKNIAEMVLDTSPTSYTSSPRFGVATGGVSLQTNGSARYLQATLNRSAANNGAWVTAQFSSDLTTWLPASPGPASNAVFDVIESAATHFTVRDKTAVTAATKRFVRLVVLSPQ